MLITPYVESNESQLNIHVCFAKHYHYIKYVIISGRVLCRLYLKNNVLLIDHQTSYGHIFVNTFFTPNVSFT